MTVTGHSLLTRRGFCFCCLTSATFATTGWLSPRDVFAQARSIVDMIRSEAATASITVHTLRRNLSVLEGSGGNMLVLNGRDGKLLVDAGITGTRARIKDALTSLGDAPVTRLINTHWHFDHTDGNEWLAADGAVIVAHANTRRHLVAAQRVEDWSFDFPPSPPIAVPTRLAQDGDVIEFAGTALTLKHHPAAHTDGDICASFAEADVIHTGDIYWNGTFPFIDYSTGGSIGGKIRAVEAILAEVTDRTIIVPGHGRPVSNRRELQLYRDMLVAVRDNVARLKQRGASLEETVAERPSAAFDEQWGQFVITPRLFTWLVYQGV